jgi:hypothetical protein
MSDSQDRPEGRAPEWKRASQPGSQIRAVIERAGDIYQRAILLHERTALRYMQLGDQRAADIELERADREGQLLRAAKAKLARIAKLASCRPRSG